MNTNTRTRNAANSFVKNVPLLFCSQVPIQVIWSNWRKIMPLFVRCDFSSVLHAIKHLVLDATTDAAADGNVIIISIRLSTIISLFQITSEAG